MGRKARVSKSVDFQPPVLPEVQTIAAGGTVFPDTSRPAKKKQKLKYPTAFIRRSPRIQSPFRNLEIEPIIEEIIISGSQDDVEPLLQEENKSNEEASDETRRSSEKDDPYVGDVNYKTMYISSQKKIEALLEENKQLSKALDLANGTIDMLEKQNNIYSEVMSIIGSLSRANENLAARVNLGHPTGDCEDVEGRNSKKRKKSV
ncbi:uncharacterized protein [Spinacia oleracea]|uniref:Uncharacterized protein isoform X2 n=1 Tax=Spinacia oleracea TaxID=3562 RepID=A0A9R0ICW2_SPIOL|nr:uncharacterized protein LOC110786710 isoform X2 [Spinacia oleracea]